MNSFSLRSFPFGNRAILSPESGVSLLELTLLLPVLILFVAGLVNVGLPASQHDVVLDATRYVGENLSRISLSSTGLTCEELSSFDRGLFGSYLQKAGMNPGGWDLVTTVENESEDTYQTQVVHVIAKSSAESSSCLFCFGGQWGHVRVRAESSFTLLGECDES